MRDQAALDRLLRAERQGLRLAIFCRTAAVALQIVWFIASRTANGHMPDPLIITVLSLFAALGVGAFLVIGTRYDRWWLKYALYAVDILGICVLFVLAPAFHPSGIEPILSFRNQGIHFLFPLIAMASLSLSWRLVAWSGLMSVIGWWAAFGFAVSGVETPLSWGDLPVNWTRDDYLALVLSPDFIATGSRVEETGFVMVAALILALAVHRARNVFFAQIEAEAAREELQRAFGRYVPEVIAERLVADRETLAPQVRRGVALVLDIENFTKYADGRDPAAVIETLGSFLADATDAISAREGVVISFTGDGLLAAFNTPLEIKAPERAALDAASDLLACAEKHGFRVRIGLAAGPVASGRVGSSRRQAFTIYGDTVNRAARLEALAKDAGATVLTDTGVAGKARPDDLLKPLGEQKIRGFEVPLEVWSKEMTALPGGTAG
ncbi:MAG: adenylate/guanylate cyclase domain-containing protein [Nisaea sp.]